MLEMLIKGKTVVISFMFSSCKAICPMTNANLLKVQKALGDHMGRDVFFYSLTLDPKTDTPEVLHKYARTIGAKPGYPTVIVPFALVPNEPTPAFPSGFDAKPGPFGVSFTGMACSEPKLIELAYAFEQATKKRIPPPLFP
jgi:Asp-tRNA(Asn)/Glu-tRNA(Gln) amidotransferase A subunit family amidase